MDAVRQHNPVLPILAAMCVVFIAGWLGILFFVVREGLDRNAGELPGIQIVPVAGNGTPTTGVRTAIVANLVVGPGANYAILGTIAEGALVEPIEFDTTGNWLAIRYPPNSTTRAWLPREAAVFPLLGEEQYRPGPFLADTLAAVNAPPGREERSLDESEVRVVGAVAGVGLPLLAFASLLVWFIGRRQAKEDGKLDSSEFWINKQVVVMEAESNMNRQVEAEPAETLRLGMADFDKAMREATEAQSTAFAVLAGLITDALAKAEQEQARFLKTQQDVLAETKEAATQSRNDAERALSAASQIESRNREQQELFVAARRERDEVNRLIGDLRTRIAALASLAAPFPSGQESAVNTHPGSSE